VAALDGNNAKNAKLDRLAPIISKQMHDVISVPPHDVD
jgi:hypothetical protein